MSAAHEVLGVPVGATAADIRKAYRRLSRTHHPDMLPPGASAAERKAAAHRFSTINSAYEQLGRAKTDALGCSSPAIANGKLIVRQKDKLVCFDLRPAK